MISEKNALGRVLLISKKLYAAAGNGEVAGNTIAMLDSLSAILSHLNSADKPISKLIGSLKRELKAADKVFFRELKPFFGRNCIVPDYDLERAAKHVPAMIYGNDKICEKMVHGQRDRARSMCSAMASYPGYIFDEYEALSDKQFYDLVFGYYPKLYDDEFMDKMKHLFYQDEEEKKNKE